MSDTKQAAVECPSCASSFDKATLTANLNVCPSCKYHFRMEPAERIAYIADEGTFVEFCHNMKSLNPSDMDGYEDKLS